MSFKSVHRFLLSAALFTGLIPAAFAQAPTANTIVSAARIQSIGPILTTVGDMDRSIDFYSRVLTFEKISDREAAGEEVEHLFGQAVEKYGDVKVPGAGSAGEKAESELFEIRNLCIGKEAPDVEGEDQDGVRFKLSDYRGKVVLLDFWSEY